jgi:threonine dehydrogenase-like Zn-dependent dehydrogenase
MRRSDRSNRGLGPFTGGQLTVVIVAVAAMFAIPTAALAAGAAFTNNSATVPAVQATNSNTKGVGVQGTGKKYGVFSNGPLGIAAGKSLSCSGCVGSSALASNARSLSNAYTSTNQVTLSNQDESQVTSLQVPAGNYIVNWNGDFPASASGGTVDCYLYVRPGGVPVDLLETTLSTGGRSTAASTDAIKNIPAGAVTMHCFTNVNGATMVGRLTLEKVGTITP